MIYRFAHFELDVGRVELRAGGVAVAVEPQVFALLRFLIENRSRVVTKDEIVEKIWNGRFVSDSAISSRVRIGSLIRTSSPACSMAVTNSRRVSIAIA